MNNLSEIVCKALICAQHEHNFIVHAITSGNLLIEGSNELLLVSISPFPPESSGLKDEKPKFLWAIPIAGEKSIEYFQVETETEALELFRRKYGNDQAHGNPTMIKI